MTHRRELLVGLPWRGVPVIGLALSLFLVWAWLVQPHWSLYTLTKAIGDGALPEVGADLRAVMSRCGHRADVDTQSLANATRLAYRARGFGGSKGTVLLSYTCPGTYVEPAGPLPPGEPQPPPPLPYPVCWVMVNAPCRGSLYGIRVGDPEALLGPTLGKRGFRPVYSWSDPLWDDRTLRFFLPLEGRVSKRLMGFALPGDPTEPRGVEMSVSVSRSTGRITTIWASDNAYQVASWPRFQ